MDSLKPFNAIVRGTFAYDGAYDAIQKANAGTNVLLVREHNNQHDKNAVRIDIEKRGFFGSKFVSVGHVSKGKAKQMAPRMDNGFQFKAKVVDAFAGDNGKFASLTVEISQVS